MLTGNVLMRLGYGSLFANRPHAVSQLIASDFAIMGFSINEKNFTHLMLN